MAGIGLDETTPGLPERARRRRASQAPDGERLGRFVVLDTVEATGPGVVHTGYDPDLDREVTLRRVAAPGPGDARAELLRAARDAAGLRHDHLATVLAVGEAGDDVYVAWERGDGLAVPAWIAARRPGWREVVRVFVRAGRGLLAVHDAALAHGGFSIDRVVVGGPGRVWVTDVGLARAAGQPRPDPRGDRRDFCAALDEAVRASGARVVPPWLRRAIARGLRAGRAGDDRREPSLARLVDDLERGLARRRRLIVAGAALAVAAGGATLGLAATGGRAAAGPRCDLAPAQLTEAWGTDARDAVRGAFAATGAPYADAAWTGVDHALTDYTRAWQQVRADTCRAARGGGPARLHQLRTMCLDDRLAELDALVAILRHADAEVVVHAVDAARSLSSVTACAGDEAGLAGLAPPGDPGAAAAVVAIRHRMAGARAAQHAGRYARARDEAEAARDTTRPLGFAPVLAAALLEVGRAAELGGDGDGARAALDEAVVVAETGRDDPTRARALIALVETEGLARARPDRAATRAAAAAAVIERLGGDVELRGRLHLASGRVARMAGDHARAVAELDAARTDLRATVGADDPVQAEVLVALAGARAELGDLDEAAALYGDALARLRAALGPRHPAVARVLAGMAVLDQWNGRLDRAAEVEREALAILDDTVGSHHPAVAHTLANLALGQVSRGDGATGLATARRAVALAEEAVGADHPEVAHALTILGNALIATGDYAGGLDVGRRALAIRVARLGADHPLTAATRYQGVALAAALLGDAATAERETRAALATFERTFGPDHVSVANAATRLGDVLADQGKQDEAVASYQRALSVLGEALGPDHVELADPLMGIGQLRLEQGRAADAVGPLERALAIRRRHAEDGLADVLMLLAEARVASGGDRASAIALAEEAEAIYATRSGAYFEDALAEVRAWLAAQRRRARPGR